MTVSSTIFEGSAGVSEPAAILSIRRASSAVGSQLQSIGGNNSSDPTAAVPGSGQITIGTGVSTITTGPAHFAVGGSSVSILKPGRYRVSVSVTIEPGSLTTTFLQIQKDSVVQSVQGTVASATDKQPISVEAVVDILGGENITANLGSNSGNNIRVYSHDVIIMELASQLLI